MNSVDKISILTECLSLAYQLLLFKKLIPQEDSLLKKKHYLYFQFEFRMSAETEEKQNSQKK